MDQLADHLASSAWLTHHGVAASKHASALASRSNEHVSQLFWLQLWCSSAQRNRIKVDCLCRMAADDTLQAASQALQALEERQRSALSTAQGRNDAHRTAEPLMASRSTNGSCHSSRQHHASAPRSRSSSNIRMHPALVTEYRYHSHTCPPSSMHVWQIHFRQTQSWTCIANIPILQE